MMERIPLNLNFKFKRYSGAAVKESLLLKC